MSPYPYMLMFPQDEHERLLIDRLGRLGIGVERPTELVDFDDRGDRVVAQLKRADGSDETCEASYLAGCDGARSRVRDCLGVGFPGGTFGTPTFGQLTNASNGRKMQVGLKLIF